MSTNQNPFKLKSAIIRQRLVAYHEKFRSQNEYGEQDIALLTGWLEGARSANDAELEGDIVHLLGLIHRLLGQTQKSLEAMQEALTIYETMGETHKDKILMVKGNIATVYADKLKDYPTAISQLQEILDMLEGMPSSGNTLNLKLSFIVNSGFYSIKCHQYRDASGYLKRFWDEWANDNLTQVHRSQLGDVTLIARLVEIVVNIVLGDYEQAGENIHLARELASQHHKDESVVDAHILQVMLAVCNPSEDRVPETYWQSTENLVAKLIDENINNTGLIKAVYEANAEHFTYLGYHDWARRCLEQADSLDKLNK